MTDFRIDRVISHIDFNRSDYVSSIAESGNKVAKETWNNCLEITEIDEITEIELKEKIEITKLCKEVEERNIREEVKKEVRVDVDETITVSNFNNSTIPLTPSLSPSYSPPISISSCPSPLPSFSLSLSLSECIREDILIPALKDEVKLKSYIETFGAWDKEEIINWSTNEFLALVFQLIISEWYEDSRDETLSKVYKDEDGYSWIYIGE